MNDRGDRIERAKVLGELYLVLLVLVCTLGLWWLL